METRRGTRHGKEHEKTRGMAWNEVKDVAMVMIHNTTNNGKESGNAVVHEKKHFCSNLNFIKLNKRWLTDHAIPILGSLVLPVSTTGKTSKLVSNVGCGSVFNLTTVVPIRKALLPGQTKYE